MDAVLVPGVEANSRRKDNHACFGVLGLIRTRDEKHLREEKGEKLMSKPFVIGALITIMSMAPAYGAPKECTDAHMKQMDAMIAKMTDRTKKKEAAAALKMSKAEMKKGNMEGCMKYMIDAHTAMLTARTESH